MIIIGRRYILTDKSIKYFDFLFYFFLKSIFLKVFFDFFVLLFSKKYFLKSIFKERIIGINKLK